MNTLYVLVPLFICLHHHHNILLKYIYTMKSYDIYIYLYILYFTYLNIGTDLTYNNKANNKRRINKTDINSNFKINHLLCSCIKTTPIIGIHSYICNFYILLCIYTRNNYVENLQLYIIILCIIHFIQQLSKRDDDKIHKVGYPFSKRVYGYL